MREFLNVAFYRFFTMEDPASHRAAVKELAVRNGIRGTILLSKEGLNAFLAGPEVSVRAVIDGLKARFPLLEGVPIKESWSDHQPFRRMLVKIKEEIIAMRRPEISPANQPSRAISPEALKEWLDRGEKPILLDTRNEYEVKIGTFEGAVHMDLARFTQFPEKAKELPEEWKGRPIVTFCTGGIRCEKAAPYLENLGFRDIYQLEGGILNYLEKCGQTHYDRDCFVFDHRVALKPDLTEADAVVCFNCRSVVQAMEQRDARYVIDRSCPACFNEGS